MLYTGYTDESELGAHDEKKCRDLYLMKKEAILQVKSRLMPHTEAVEEARHFVEEAIKEMRTQNNNIGDELDPEQEKEIEECENGNDDLHPDFLQLNPEGLE